MKALIFLMAFSATTILSCAAQAGEKAPIIQEQTRKVEMKAAMSDAKKDYVVLGGGCFWCLEAVFEKLPGVQGAVSGYSGGTTKNPTYEAVCSGETGHIEVVKIDFDPSIVTLNSLLDIFWKIHDPTSRDRQGSDIGIQYRSVIFYHDAAQKEVIDASVRHLGTELANPIVTEILPEEIFWSAEEYHQDYFRKNPDNAYCRMAIPPKLKKAGF